MDWGETFFNVHRKIFENGIWKHPVELRLFLWILGNSQFSEKGMNYGAIKIQRGQYLRSYRKLQCDLIYVENRTVKKYSLSTIERAVKQLIAMQIIAVCGTELGTLFTVLNYDKYQLNQSKNSTYDGTQQPYKLELGTELGTNAEHIRDNNNNVNKENNKYVHFFDEFWNSYPKKTNKFKAQQTFLKLIKSEKVFDEVMKGLKIQKESIQWRTENGKYIPHPTTWLNGRRWEDETIGNVELYTKQVNKIYAVGEYQ